MPSDSRHHESRYDNYGRTLRPDQRDDSHRSGRDDRGDSSWRGNREPREAAGRDRDYSRRLSRQDGSDEDEGRGRGIYRHTGYSSNPYGPIGEYYLLFSYA